MDIGTVEEDEPALGVSVGGSRLSFEYIMFGEKAVDVTVAALCISDMFRIGSYPGGGR